MIRVVDPSLVQKPMCSRVVGASVTCFFRGPRHGPEYLPPRVGRREKRGVRRRWNRRGRGRCWVHEGRRGFRGNRYPSETSSVRRFERVSVHFSIETRTIHGSSKIGRVSLDLTEKNIRIFGPDIGKRVEHGVIKKNLPELLIGRSSATQQQHILHHVHGRTCSVDRKIDDLHLHVNRRERTSGYVQSSGPHVHLVSVVSGD